MLYIVSRILLQICLYLVLRCFVLRVFYFLLAEDLSYDLMVMYEKVLFVSSASSALGFL
jgi:hypothetical protein